MRPRRKLDTIAGSFVGATGAISSGDGFSVVRTAAGTYTVTFASGFRCVSIVAGTGSVGFPAAAASGGATASVVSYNSATQVAADTGTVYFIATGVQS